MKTRIPPISEATALVADGYAPSRCILVSQLREFGVGKISQCSRITDARVKLEHSHFDFVLCEQNFQDDSQSGQGLLEDLRRAQLLPFSTVFFLVTTSASYSMVADAVESALDGFLLKPFTTNSLFDRLNAARIRKAHFAPIFELIDIGDFSKAASLCLERFDERRLFWLYAARIGAELMLRIGQFADAQRLFEAVIQAKTLPWAKLGVARAQIEGGHTLRALGTLERMISDDAGCADAYDVLGGAQIEVGKFDEALATYKLATVLTPGSLCRVQKYGMMAYYMGDHVTATAVLTRASVIGINSKIFDAQTLVLLAFAMFKNNDRKGLDRCHLDLGRILEKTQGNDKRVRRFQFIAKTLQLMQARQFAMAIQSLKRQALELRSPDLDFEAASNFCGLMCAMASTSVEMDEGSGWVKEIGLRFSCSRSLSEMLARACIMHQPYAQVMRESLLQINKTAEISMAHSLGGDPDAAVKELLKFGHLTLNSKLADLAFQLLNRHAGKINGAASLFKDVAVLREACGKQSRRSALSVDTFRNFVPLSLNNKYLETETAIP